MLDGDEIDENLSYCFELAETPHGTVDNVMRIHSLRPSTMIGHVKLYKAVLHDDENVLPKWFQETVSSYVSILNNCDYSLKNHWANACHLLNDTNKSDMIFEALRARKPDVFFVGYELEILNYAEKLTLYPSEISQNDIDRLRKSGLDDGEILEANQIVCYFNYANRLINGLGVTTEGDTVGYYNEHGK